MENFYKRVSKVQKELKAPKNQRNTFGNYNYRSCEDILEAAKPLLADNGLLLVVSDSIEEVSGRFYIKATAALYDTESDNVLINTAYAREEESKKGMDASQVTGTASSYARKYALNGLFCIDDTKDADTDEHKKQQGAGDAAKVETLADARELVLNFGKHKGETLWEVWKTDIDYISYLWENAQDQSVRQALTIINESIRANRAAKQGG